MVIPKTVLLVSRDAVSLQAREEQLREHGFATRLATDVEELQAAFKQQDHPRVDVAVVGAALPVKEKFRITTILRDEAKRIPIVLLADTEAGIVDNPDAVLQTSASAAEFVDAIRKVCKV
jgi:DNA-binding response OmpR family regulator